MSKTSKKHHKISFIFALVFSILILTGCGPKISTVEQLEKFEQAGPTLANADVESLDKVKTHNGPYRVIPGDLLELQIPVILGNFTSEASKSLQKVEPYLCRVSDTGNITLAIVGEIQVAGRTLGEIEMLVVGAYYPKYVVTAPVVVCQVKQYQGENERVFTVMGLVNRPHTFAYPANVQYNLMEVLAFAGGFDPIADPRYLRIYRHDEKGEVVSATFSIDNKSLDDAYSVMIKPGDVIFVDHTLRTRTNAFLANVLSIGVGADVRYSGR